jgi:CheY-like chemotaxis protein
VRVLVANEPRSYREAFAFAFRTLRPHVEAIVVEPEALEREALRLRPDLVVCDRVTPAVAAITRLLDGTPRGGRGAGGRERRPRPRRPRREPRQSSRVHRPERGGDRVC